MVVGTKNTSDPAAKNPIQEGVGVVTSDSLAAESLKGSGSFGDGNPKAAASSQPSHSTTTNNADVSGATRLAPAVDAEAREAQEGWSETQQLNAGSGLGKDVGKGPTWNTNSSSGAGSHYVPQSSSETSDFTSSAGTVTGGYAGAADKARSDGEFYPKGTGVTEDEGLSGKTKFGAVGTKEDPSRLAEDKFAKSNAQSGADAGYAKGGNSAQSGTYSSLRDEAA